MASAQVAESLAREGRVPAWKDGWDTSALPEPTRRAVDLLNARCSGLELYLDLDIIPSLLQTLLHQGDLVVTGQATAQAAADAVADQVEKLARARLHSPATE
jgi:hypothetical protein